MKLSAFCATFFALSPFVFAQQQPLPRSEPQAQTPADNGSIPATLIQPIERAANYLNLYVFFDGTYDNATSPLGGPNVSGLAVGGGGGISANHDFATGTFQMSYRGDYRSYADPEYTGGTDQNLTLLYRKVLNRRWTFSFNEAAGIFPEGTAFLQPSQTTSANILQTSPFSTNLKFTGTSVALAYKQTARLSYEFTGSYYIMRYNSPLSYGNNDASGTGSALYRLTRDTTVSGTYQLNSFRYQHNAGSANSNTVYATLSHNLANHWTVGASAGATYTTDSGVVRLPESFQYGQYIIPVIVEGHYKQKSTLPYFQGTLARTYKHQLLSLSGGESVTPGNGFFLASRNLGVSGLFSHTAARSNISAGGYYSRLTSISTTASSEINTTDLQVSYSYDVIRHLGTNVRYDHINYNTVGGYRGTSDNRVTFSVYFTTKDIPVALF